MTKTNMFDLQELVLELAEGSVLEEQDIHASTPLSQVGFDSLKIVQLIMEIEQRLELSIIDQDINLQDFFSIETIQCFLDRTGDIS